MGRLHPVASVGAVLRVPTGRVLRQGGADLPRNYGPAGVERAFVSYRANGQRDFVFHVRWADTPSVGFIELYYDGELVIPRRSAATNMPGQLNYLKQGLYRDEAIEPDGIVFHDAMIQATSLNDVMPQAPVTPPDAGTPPAGADGGAADPTSGTSGATLPGGTGLTATGGCSTSGAHLVPWVMVLVPAFFLLRLMAPQRERQRQRRQARR